jgi:hypothetical protein
VNPCRRGRAGVRIPATVPLSCRGRRGGSPPARECQRPGRDRPCGESGSHSSEVGAAATGCCRITADATAIVVVTTQGTNLRGGPARETQICVTFLVQPSSARPYGGPLAGDGCALLTTAGIYATSSHGRDRQLGSPGGLPWRWGARGVTGSDPGRSQSPKHARLLDRGLRRRRC